MSAALPAFPADLEERKDDADGFALDSFRIGAISESATPFDSGARRSRSPVVVSL